jgi:energy-coupling factor transport system ATP-binding protein
VSFSYGDGHALKNITFEVCKGEIIALMGDNGSGKTTLVKILSGLLEPDTGEVHAERIPLRKLDRKTIARKISVVFQNPNHQIFERTVWKEQTLTLDVLGLTNEIYVEQSEAYLRAANLDNYKERNPFSLSHGQKRRLNVSSVATHNPDVFLFDEPFIGQDHEGRAFIVDIISNKVRNGGAAVVITHDPNFALHFCTRTIFMDQGSILLDGAPETVFHRLEEMGRHEYTKLEVIL